MRRLTALLSLVVPLALAFTLLTAVPAEAVKPWRYQNQAIEATNNRRAEHGKVRLRGQQWCLKRYAVAQAARMARQKRMFHQRLRPVLNQCRMRRVGENVAYGYRNGWNTVNRGWMRSPSHRANLLDGRYRVVAVGARRASNGTWYVSQVLGVHR